MWQNSVDWIRSCAQVVFIKSIVISKRNRKLANSILYKTIKDHKDNFPATIKCRLISTSKTDIGKISKVILASIINSVRSVTGLIQWKKKPVSC